MSFLTIVSIALMYERLAGRMAGKIPLFSMGWTLLQYCYE